MKAMLVNEKRELVWSDVPDPAVKEDEMRIEIHAAPRIRRRSWRMRSAPLTGEWMP